MYPGTSLRSTFAREIQSKLLHKQCLDCMHRDVGHVAFAFCSAFYVFSLLLLEPNIFLLKQSPAAENVVLEMKKILEILSRVGDKKDKSPRRGIVSRKLLGTGRTRASGFGSGFNMSKSDALSKSDASLRRPSQAKKKFAKSRSDSTLLQSLPSKLVHDYILAFEDLSFGEKIGAGGNGQVFRGMLDGYIPVAIKQVYSQMMVPTNVEDFKKEAIALAEVAHPGVVRFYGITEDAGKLYIVTELCPTQVEDLLGPIPRSPGGLAGVLHKLRGLQVAADVADTMASLHMRGIVHLDLKPENLLVDADQQVKICDFGLAATVSRAGVFQKDWSPVDSEWNDAMNDSRSYQHGGSPPYVAPEMLSIVFNGLFDATSSLNCNWLPIPPTTSGPRCRTLIGHSHSIRKQLDTESIDCRSVDTYAFGVMLWALWHRTKPFARIRSRVREAAVAAFIAQHKRAQRESESSIEEKCEDPPLELASDSHSDPLDDAVVIPSDETKKATKGVHYPRYPLGVPPSVTASASTSVTASVNANNINDAIDNPDGDGDGEGDGDDDGEGDGDKGEIEDKGEGANGDGKDQSAGVGEGNPVAESASSSYNTELSRLKQWVEYASWNDLVVIGVSKYKLRWAASE